MVLYATYLNIGIDGLQALEHYNFEDEAWGQVHHQVRVRTPSSHPPQSNSSQAHFSVLNYLLQDGGGGIISLAHDLRQQSQTVHVDQSKIYSHGKPSLGRYPCKLHIWRCTADVSACREFYKPMCAVDGVYEAWRKIVVSKTEDEVEVCAAEYFCQG